MKKILLALAVVAMTAGMAFAANDEKKCDKKEGVKCEQTSKCDKDHKGGCELREFQGLELTDAQKTQLKALKADCKAKKMEAKQAEKAEKAQKAEARHACRKDYLEKVKGILTPEQYTKYLENQKVGHAPRHHHADKAARGEKACKAAGKDMKACPKAAAKAAGETLEKKSK